MFKNLEIERLVMDLDIDVLSLKDLRQRAYRKHSEQKLLQYIQT